MGYRLNVQQITKEPEFYGTKMYGYVTDVTALKSFRWLAAHNKIDTEADRDCWDAYASMDIRMTAEEFREFIQLYVEDLYKNDCGELSVEKDIALGHLFNSEEDKIVSWG